MGKRKKARVEVLFTQGSRRWRGGMRGIGYLLRGVIATYYRVQKQSYRAAS